MKRIAWIAVLVILLGLPLFSQTALIVYDGAKQKSEAYKSARYIEGLLGHFTLESKRVLQAQEYRAGEALAADFVFVMFEEGDEGPPRAFLRDILKTRATVIWLNLQVDRLLDQAGRKWGIRYKDWVENKNWTVEYKDTAFGKEDPGANLIQVDDPGRVKVLSVLKDNRGASFPYALHSENLWVFADSPFAYMAEGGRFLIFADLLHDILGQDHPPSRKALVRIEDVSPEDDPKFLSEAASYLHHQGVPFQVAFIPIFRDPGEQVETYIADRPEMAAVLRGMNRLGGSLVLHGVTHQNRGLSGDDFEFWDDIAGVPIRHESADWVDQRLNLGLRECARNGLYPLAWETPHYSGSKKDYQTIAKYFDTFYDRVMAAELAGTQQIFPYPVRLEDLGVSVIPENLGYIDLQKPDPDALLQSARRMLVVRDGLASFFFHPFVDLKYLKALIQGLRGSGWEFISIRDFPCRVHSDQLWLTTTGGEGRITAENQYVHRLRLDRQGRVVNETYSASREKGIVSDTVTLAPGELYVLEAVDLLPDSSRKGLFSRVGTWVARLFQKKGTEPAVTIPRTLLLYEKWAAPGQDNDQKSFLSVLRIFGFNPVVQAATAIPSLALSSFDLVVVPAASAQALKNPDVAALTGFVEGGGLLLTDGPSALARQLGIRFGEKAVRVRGMKELSIPAPDLLWNPEETVSPPSSDEALILAKDAGSDTSLVLLKSLGKGRALFLATLFDSRTPYGVTRYSYLPFYLKNSLGLPFNVRRNNLEFYFDPGFHPGTSWEKLVARWRASGVRIVYLAAWHFYSSYQFDYRYFINLCHNHGIAVYAWFELPQVTPLFWETHPEWREKTASGRDAGVGWRLQMNLLNPRARAEALKFFRELLLAHDWDGLNLAELSFDTTSGAKDPAGFVPMSLDVRRAFQKTAGLDPAELFNPASVHHWTKDRPLFNQFLRFRTDLVRDYHLAFLEEAEGVKRTKGRDMEIIVTVMDSVCHPEIVEECGVSTPDIIALMDRYPFMLQVEEPHTSWGEPPTRYLRYYESYKPLVRDPKRLMFDINCVSDRDIASTSLPSAAPTGTELATTLFYATFPSGRAAVYSEATVLPADMDILPYVMGSDVEIREDRGGYAIQSGGPFVLSLNRQDRLPYLNGGKWPFFGTRGISLPSGTSRLTFKKTGLFNIEALSLKMIFSGDISQFTSSGRAYRLTYSSPVPVSLTFSRPLNRIAVDSLDIALAADKSGLVLPRGRHLLEIFPESAPAQAVNTVGYVSSTVLSGAGLLAVALLLALYLYARLRP